MKIQDIHSFREKSIPWLQLLLLANGGIAIAAAVYNGTSVVLVGGAVIALSALGLFALGRATESPTWRCLVAVAMQGQVTLFVGAMAGHVYQSDAHMQFFATMGVLILLADFRAILAGSATVAIHHVLLNFALPNLVYPAGSDFARLVMHALILILASVPLCFASLALVNMSDAAASQRGDRNAMVDRLANAFGAVVGAALKGDFSVRVQSTFEDAKLQDVAAKTNDLMGTVDTGLKEVGRVMSQVAQGQVETRMAGTFEGAFQTLQNDVNTTVTRLRDVIADIEQACHAMAIETDALHEGSETLSQQANHQATSVKEASAAMQNLTDTVRANEASCQQMSSVVSETKDDGDAGRKIVEDATAAMEKMAQSSGKISEIVEVMNEISFQTNLLALNASVEAARAGEAGKGFAVVASEVRALALRSTDAAQGINDLIGQSSRDMKQGIDFVTQLGAVVNEIVAAVAGLSTQAQDIASNSSAQAGNIEEINATVAGIDTNTQQTAAAAEDTLVRVQTMRQQADLLRRALDRFSGTSQASGPEAQAA